MFTNFGSWAVTKVDALGNQTYIAYNALGRRIKMTDGNGDVTQYSYDGLNQLKTTTYLADSETVTYTYNAAGNRTQMADSLGTTTTVYDDLYRVITVTNPFTGNVGYEYDLVGNRTGLVYPDGHTITSTYNADNRLIQVEDWDGGFTTYTYNNAAQLITTTLPNGVQTVNVYDMAGQLLRLTHTNTVTGTLVAEYQYQLDRLGNPLTTTETTRLPDNNLQTTIIVNTYDPLYRLTDITYSGILTGTTSYTYNAIGQRTAYTTDITQTQTITYQYNAANQLVVSVESGGDTTTYDWDDVGRLITTTVAGSISRLYDYSQDGDLISALVDGITTTFTYDGAGNRLQMSVAGEVTTYTLDYAAGSRILFETGGAFANSKHYLYGLACIGEQVDADIPATEEWRYYHRDRKTLVRQTTNSQTAVTLAWTFSPEGAVLLGEEGPVTHLDCDNAVYDFSTGLIFKQSNYFDPRNGIWSTIGGIVIWNSSQSYTHKRRRRKRKR
ncbi:MAG: RHS repeat protein, partial [Chloroflexi bacterium]|nr:RHS repeat protein [Chloroflexota bacterium]